MVLRYGSGKEPVFKSRMAAFGIPEHPEPDEGVRSALGIYGKVNAHVDVDQDNGDSFLCINFSTEDAGKLPPDDNPVFALIWRSDLLVEREVELFEFVHHPDVVDDETGEIITRGYREKVSLGLHLITTTEEWPTYSVEDRDEDGIGLGTYHQVPVGGIG